MQKAKGSVIITHIGSWLLFLSLPVVFITSQSKSSTVGDIISSRSYWLCFTFFIVIFYLHTYVLFPKLYRLNKQVLYFLSIAFLFFLLLWIKPFDKMMDNWRHHFSPQQAQAYQPPLQQPPFDETFNNRSLPPRGFNNVQPPPGSIYDSLHRFSPRTERMWRANRNRVDIVSIFMFIVIIAISVSLDVSKRLQIAAQQAAKAEADKANAELFALKAQVNPHFLFNTLNNIYSLAVTGDENTAESIMKLSNIMRYVTDDTAEDFVPLQKEVDCIDDFIDLQRLRIGSKVKLDYTVHGAIDGRQIAPFVLLTFIENVFKYGVRNQSNSHIVIRLSVAGKDINLYCCNPLPEEKESNDRKGTGIANVKKRLAYLYPGRHTLSISEDSQLYTVQLLIQDKQ